jgi:hypothetical protein
LASSFRGFPPCLVKLLNKKIKNIFERLTDDLFTPVYQIYSYNTRLLSNLCFSLPKIRTNFGLSINIRYQGVKAWNVLSEADKQMTFFTT